MNMWIVPPTSLQTHSLLNDFKKEKKSQTIDFKVLLFKNEWQLSESNTIVLLLFSFFFFPANLIVHYLETKQGAFAVLATVYL